MLTDEQSNGRKLLYRLLLQADALKVYIQTLESNYLYNFLPSNWFHTLEFLKEYTHKDYLSFQNKGVFVRLTFCNKFYENRWIGFEDIDMCIFLSV